MNLKQVQKKYAIILFSLFIIPNAFVIILGIESFPLTCAPMFGHYINDDTKLYEFKFEGVKNTQAIDLIDYLDKPENCFMRHFFSKVYGSTHAISPFANKLSDSDEYFQNRMNMFFNQYENEVLFKKYHLTFDYINLKVIRVNQKREHLSKPEIIGYYDCLGKCYHSVFKAKLSLDQTKNILINETY